MDISDLRGIQFLDLTDVDDNEKIRIISSLERDDQSVQLPWFKCRKTYAENPPKKIHNAHAIPVAPTPYEYPSNIPNNSTIYFNTPVSSICTTYPAVIPIKPVIFPASFNNRPTTEYISFKEPLAAAQNNIPTDLHGIETQNNFIMVPINGVASDQQQKKETATPTWGANKTWASLFNSGKANNKSDVKSVSKPGPQTVTQETNNNVMVCPFKNPHKDECFDPDCYRMGEFLLNYTVDGKIISLQPRGLINQSNYCYINSILQALIACPPFYNLVVNLSLNLTSNAKRKPTPVVDAMCKFVKEFKHLPAGQRVGRRSDKNQKAANIVSISCDMPFEPNWIYKLLNGFQTDLIEGRQEDADEFLGIMLNGLNDEMLELIKLVKSDNVELVVNEEKDDLEKEWLVMGKKKCSVTRRTEFDKTPISEIFGGFLKSRIHRAGDPVTENIQPFFTLPLNIESVSSVPEALEAFLTKYQLEGVTSSKTKEEVEAWQQVMLHKLPVVLILHLKCFDFKQDCKKIIKPLKFPIDLKIDFKLLSNGNSPTNKKQYKLFAVVYHDGKEASKGHYITDAFHVGYNSWLRYDDASVKAVPEEHVLKPQGTRVPYLLFYRRSGTFNINKK